jgi:hypothetical protein
VAVRMAKQAMQEGVQVDLATGLQIEKLCYAQVKNKCVCMYVLCGIFGVLWVVCWW